MRPWLWLSALGVLSVVVVIVHMFDPSTGAQARLHEILDVAHVIGFAAVTWVVSDRALSVMSPRGVSPWIVIAGVIVFAGLLAMVSEVAQSFVGRDADVDDLLRDAGGIFAGALFCGVVRLGIRPRPLWIAVGCGVLGVVLWAPGRVLVAMAAAWQRRPVLMGFETRLDELLFSGIDAYAERVAADDTWPLPGFLAEVRPVGRGYSGITFPRLPADWSPYASLSFLIASRDSTTGTATLRIHDGRHDKSYEDRFNRAFEFGPAAMRMRVSLDDVRHGPEGRELDISDIAGLTVFVVGAESGGFRIDDLRLE